MKTRIFLALALLTAVFAAYGNNSPKQPAGRGWIDPGFAKVLQQKGYIANANTVTPADVAEIIKVDVDWAELTSLKGIEYFESLQELDCGFNKLTTLDVSRNTKLTMLSCQKNQLTALDVSCNPQLIDLTCFGNKLTALDVSCNPRLMWFNCWDNQLTTLDVSGNPLLMWLNCYGNQLRGLDISNNKQLTDLTCHDNPGADGRFVVEAWFDNSEVPSSITGNTDYKSSWVYQGRTVRIDYTISNRWIDPDFAKVLQQSGYIADANTVTPADVAEITEVYVYQSGLTSLRGIEYFVSIEVLGCSGNQLTTLDVSRNPQLTELYCWGNQLTTLDVSRNPQLMELWCGENHLTTLNMSRNPQLTTLRCGRNQLTTLDVSKNPQLDELWCNGNKLTALDVSNNQHLTKLWCDGNQLTTLDVSRNPQLTELDCSGNQLKSLNVSNNPHLTELNCGGNNLTTLDVSRNLHLTELYCYENQLMTLDVSRNPQLTTLNCSGNQLTTLDVSTNPRLMWIVCSDNQLKSLNVSNNPQLTVLSCYDNQLTTLDVSRNPQLTTLLCYGNPGANGQFVVEAWFDNSDVPSLITDDEHYKSSWFYKGRTVKIDFINSATTRTSSGGGATETFNAYGGVVRGGTIGGRKIGVPSVSEKSSRPGKVVVRIAVNRDGIQTQQPRILSNTTGDPSIESDCLRIARGARVSPSVDALAEQYADIEIIYQ